MKRLVCIILSLLLLVLSFCGCDNKTDPLTQSIIKYNLEAEPKSLDPQIATDYSSKIVITNLFEGLCKIDSKNNIIPGAASSWTSNSDYTSFTFNIRTDAMWANNEKVPVTAHDFVFAFKRALDPETASSEGKALYAIKNAQSINLGLMDVSNLGVYALNDKTLKIDLEYQYEEFPKIMASTVAMPCNESFFRNTGGQYGLECEYLLTNGAYKFTNRYSWDHGNTISLSRNMYYHDSSNVIPEGISFIMNSDIIDTVSSVKSGIIDCANIPGDQLKSAVDENMNLTFFEDTTWGLCFNLEDSVFGNFNIRSGFINSLDRDYITKSLTENYNKDDDIIPPCTTLAGQNYRSIAGNDLGIYNDSQLAREKLMQGLKQVDKESIPNITVLCLNSTATKAIVSSALELWNRNLGVYFNMNPVSQSELSSAIANKNYQVALVPLRAKADGPYEFLSIFRSDNPLNPAGLKDADYDMLIAEIFENEGNNSLPYCIEAERFLNQNAIFYPVCFEKRYFASASGVTDVIFYPYDGGIDFMLTKKQKS